VPCLQTYPANALHRVSPPIPICRPADLTDSSRNDAVVPISESHPGCPVDPDGLCSFDKVVSVLQNRIAEIDFNYDCFANCTAHPGVNYNG
jgi:hypothetical protein